MTDRLKDKVAIVTGGSSGIGRETVLRFAEEGAKVVIADINIELGEELAKENPDSTIFVKLDASDPDDWENLKNITLEKYGTVDILINNAGISMAKSIFDITLDEYKRIVSINQISVFLGIKTIAPIMKEKGYGSIVNTSSLNGMKAGAPGYTDTKFAVRGLTKAASQELAPFGVRVNSVHPGVIETPMVTHNDAIEQIKQFAKTIPMKRIAKPKEIANLMLYLASDESSYSTGSEFIADGGITQ